jgi:hypothetical protein
VKPNGSTQLGWFIHNRVMIHKELCWMVWWWLLVHSGEQELALMQFEQTKSLAYLLDFTKEQKEVTFWRNSSFFLVFRFITVSSWVLELVWHWLCAYCNFGFLRSSRNFRPSLDRPSQTGFTKTLFTMLTIYCSNNFKEYGVESSVFSVNFSVM